MQRAELAQIAKRDYVFFYPGNIYMSLESFSGEGYYFQDAQCNRLDDPFPSLSAIQQKGKNIDQLVADLNKRMQNRAEQISARNAN